MSAKSPIKVSPLAPKVVPVLPAIEGVRLATAAAGIRYKGRTDVLLALMDKGTAVAGVFTQSKCPSAPVDWCRARLGRGVARALVVNSGNANAFTGKTGRQSTSLTASIAAKAAGCSLNEVFLASTGVIGHRVPVDKIERAMPELVSGLKETGIAEAEEAIMTTDKMPKIALSRGTIDGKEITVCGMAKGAGMLAPQLATMLVVITTDAMIAAADLDTALRASTRVSFDRLDSDGCMSTNDQVSLLASGASGVEPSLDSFTEVLTAVCLDLAEQLQGDAEGASHDIRIEVVGAATEDDAVEVGRSVARNNLFKAAVFGNDPNWGRVLAAIGTTDAAFDPYDVDVSMNGVRVCHAGAPDRPRTDVDLSPRRVDLLIDLKSGQHTATILTNDLTHDYVHENSAYSS